MSQDFSFPYASNAAKPRKRRSSAQVKALILAAAREEFAASGIAGATTRAIATRASVSEPLIFTHFGSKSTLFSVAVIEPFLKATESFNEHIDALPFDLETRSLEIVSLLLGFFGHNAELLHALVKSSGHPDPKLTHALDGHFAEIERRIRRFYAAPDGSFEVDPRLSSRLTFGMVAASVLLRDWFFPDGEVPQSDVASALSRLALNALTPGRFTGQKEGPAR